jgi:hypothetical protein
MAKLPQDKAAKAAAEKDNVPEFGPVPPGVYLCRLTNVDPSRSGAAGPYWVWEATTVGAGTEPTGKKFWDNTSLSDQAIGRLGKVFEAFGVTPEADTEDLIGKLVAVEVTRVTQKGGENAGQLKNDVRAWHPAFVHPLAEDFQQAAGVAPSTADDY